MRALIEVRHLPVGVYAAGLAGGADRRSQGGRLVTGGGVVGRDHGNSARLVLGARQLARLLQFARKLEVHGVALAGQQIVVDHLAQQRVAKAEPALLVSHEHMLGHRFT